MNGDSSKNAMAKNEMNRRADNVQICIEISCLLLLFLKYNVSATTAEAIIAAISSANQYFIPNEINVLSVISGRKYT